MRGTVITSGARTRQAIGGAEGFAAVELGGLAIKAALEKAGITGEQVDYVIMGHVPQAGAGQTANPA